MTKNAQIILDEINKTKQHLTAEELYIKLLETGNKMSMATIYNSLQWLCQNNLIKKIFIEGSMDRYDRVDKHDHLICVKCGKISDIKLKDLTKTLSQQLGENIVDYDLKVNYICTNCKKEKKEKRGN